MRRRASGPTRRCRRRSSVRRRQQAGRSSPAGRIGRTAITSSSIRRTRRSPTTGTARMPCWGSWRPHGASARGRSPSGWKPAATGFGRRTLAITSWAGSAALANGGRRSAGVCKWTRALRVDRYSQFGASWNPSAGIGWWPADAVRLRASAARAFRVPTFTERYYSDPANLARAEVGPETAWAGEGGADLFLRGGWMVQATLFGRADSRCHRLAAADHGRSLADLQRPRRRYARLRSGRAEDVHRGRVRERAVHGD